MSFISDVIGRIKKDVQSQLDYRVIDFGGKAVAVEGFIRVINVSPDSVEFLYKRCKIAVRGKNLKIAEIYGGFAMVEGEIGGVYREQ